MNKLKRIINRARKNLQMFDGSKEFNDGYVACWLSICKMIQKDYNEEDMRVSENLKYKIRCLQEDYKLLEARFDNLKRTNDLLKKDSKELKQKV